MFPIRAGAAGMAMCALCALALPAGAAEFESAVFEAAAGKLSVHAAEEIDIYSIYSSRLAVEDLNDTARLGLADFAGLHNGTVLEFRLDAADSAALLGMSAPGLVADHAAVTFRSGAASGAQSLQLRLIGGINDIPAPPAILSHATYAADVRVLEVRTAEPIDTSSITTHKISIRGDHCHEVYPSIAEFEGVHEGKTVVRFEMSDASHDIIEMMVNPRLHAAAGAFVAESAGLRSGEDEIPLSVVGIDGGQGGAAKPAGLQPGAVCRFAYSVGDPSDILTAEKYGAMEAAKLALDAIEAVRLGLDAWTQINGGITFQRVEGEADIVVEWIGYNPEYMGQGCLDCLAHGAYIRVALESPDCRGAMQALDQATIIHTVAHEFGHNLGLQHNTIPDHLMWAESGFIQRPYDDLGYAIPDLPRGQLIGEDELSERYDSLTQDLDEYKRELRALDRRIDDASSRGDYSAANSLVGQYNAVVDRHNRAYYELVEVVDDLNCLLNVS